MLAVTWNREIYISSAVFFIHMHGNGDGHLFLIILKIHFNPSRGGCWPVRQTHYLIENESKWDTLIVFLYIVRVWHVCYYDIRGPGTTAPKWVTSTKPVENRMHDDESIVFAWSCVCVCVCLFEFVSNPGINKIYRTSLGRVASSSRNFFSPQITNLPNTSLELEAINNK